jgi:hypothetical protein
VKLLEFLFEEIADALPVNGPVQPAYKYVKFFC